MNLKEWSYKDLRIDKDFMEEALGISWNISNLRYVDDTALMAEMEEELKSLLMKVKGERDKNCLKIQYSEKTKIIASGPIIHGK